MLPNCKITANIYFVVSRTEASLTDRLPDQSLARRLIYKVFSTYL